MPQQAMGPRRGLSRDWKVVPQPSSRRNRTTSTRYLLPFPRRNVVGLAALNLEAHALIPPGQTLMSKWRLMVASAEIRLQGNIRHVRLQKSARKGRGLVWGV